MRDPKEQRRPAGGRSHLVVLGLVIAVLAAVFAAGYFNPVRLGLDLQGGLEVVLKATPTDGKKLTSEQLEQSVEVIRDRVDALGTTEPEIRTQGSDQIVVTLPGEDDPDRAVQVVGKTAQLRFYEWERYVVDDKAFRSAYEALRSARERVREAGKEAEKEGREVVPQLYLFDAEQRQVAGPAASRERLLAQARDALNAMPEDERPAGAPEIVDHEEPRLPREWDVLEVPPGEVLVHGPPEQIGMNLQRGGRFDRSLGAFVLLEDKPALSGEHIRSATAEASQGGWATSIIFDRKGGRLFGEVTERIARDGALKGTPQRFGIVLDDEVKSVPQIDYRQYPSGIKGSQAQISGLDDREEAQDLALVLNTGALPVRFEVVSRTQVSATLGEQSLQQGLLAGAAGLLVVMVYLVLFYRVLGLIADLALVAFAMIFYGVVVTVPVTMTLPGIAGAILTVGVAADANIIIFERIREEYRAGRSVVQSIKAGYRKGFATIIDASAVTLITAALLIVVSIGSVRGFAVLLGIGTVLSIFTAVFFTFAVLGVLSQVRAFQKPWVIGGSRKRTTTRFNIKWMRRRRYFLRSMTVMIFLSLAIVGVKGLNLGVDFKSGTRFDVQLERDVSAEQVRDVLVTVNPAYANATVQETRDVVAGAEEQEGSSFSLTLEELRGGEEVAAGDAEQTRQNQAQDAISRALDREFGLVDDPAIQTIGPSFGAQVIQLAIIAVLLSLVLESLYIWWRFEFIYAVPILVTLVHDMAISAGAYALTGREFKSTTVAALLTILGYSLYDTIIVFDRIRENVHLLRKSSFRRIVDVSLNEVLTRSLNTSFVVLLPTAALFVFGGETLKDFAFALLVGVAVGMFSSITVAAPLLCWLKEREPAWQKRLEAERSLEASRAATGGPAAPVAGGEPVTAGSDAHDAHT